MNLLDLVVQFVTEILAVNIWQLVAIFFGLLVLKKVKDDVRPIFVGMISPLQRQAQTNSATWALALMLAVLSMIGAIKEVADSMHWVYLGFACKISNAPLALLVGIIKQSQGQASPPPPAAGTTTPPFTPASPPPIVSQ